MLTVLGAYTPREHAHTAGTHDGSDSTQERKRSAHSGKNSGPTQDETDGRPGSPTTVLGSGSDRSPTRTSTPTHTPIHTPPPGAVSPSSVKSAPPKPSVRFSDDVTLVCSPAPGPVNNAPRTMYRRLSSSGVGPTPDWGALFDANGFPTVRCGQVLRGLARYLVRCRCFPFKSFF